MTVHHWSRSTVSLTVLNLELRAGCPRYSSPPLHHSNSAVQNRRKKLRKRKNRQETDPTKFRLS